MQFLILGRSVGLKKKTFKNNHKKSRNRRPGYPGTTLKVNIHIIGLINLQFAVKNVPVFLYAVTMIIFRWIKRIIPSEKWFNYVITFFFLKMPKTWVGRMMLNRGKKEDGLRLMG